MTGPFGFFRVFDVSFFIPGAIVLISTLFRLGLLQDMAGDSTSTISAITLGITFLISAFVIGLAIHGLGRMVITICRWDCSVRFRRWCSGVGVWFRCCLASKKRSRWFTSLDGQSAELAIYFWYIRTTCVNTSVGLAIAFFILFWGSDKVAIELKMWHASYSLVPLSFSIVSVAWILAAVVIFSLSGEYENARDQASEASRQPVLSSVEHDLLKQLIAAFHTLSGSDTATSSGPPEVDQAKDAGNPSDVEAD